MTRSGKKQLSPEDRDLWRRVAETAIPLDPDPRRRDPHDRDPHGPKPALPEKPRHRPQIRRFQIGQNAAPPAPRHDLAPSLHDDLAGGPVKMDRGRFDRLRRGKLEPEARIDLHGMTLQRAQPALTGFVMKAHAGGKRLVLVITGKGRNGPDDGPIPQRRGLLRHQVPQWLSSPPLGGLVLQVAVAHRRHGGTGAYYVYLRRHR